MVVRETVRVILKVLNADGVELRSSPHFARRMFLLDQIIFVKSMEMTILNHTDFQFMAA